MPNDISSISIKISGDNKELIAAIAGSNSALNRLAGGVDRASAALDNSAIKLAKYVTRVAAAYTVIQGAIRVWDQFADSIRLASEAEQAEVAFTTMLQSAQQANTLLDEMYTFVEKTPFRLDEVRDAAKSLVAFGYTVSEVIPTLRSLGDISAGIGIPITELAVLLGKARIEGRQYTRDLRQFATAGIPIYQELASAFGVATSEINNLAEQGLISFYDVEQAIARLTAEGSQFGGLMSEQADTLGGAWSNLLDELDQLKRELGTALLPALKDLVVVIRVLKKELTEGANIEWISNAAKDTLAWAVAIARLGVGISNTLGESALTTLLPGQIQASIASFKVFDGVLNQVGTSWSEIFEIVTGFASARDDIDAAAEALANVGEQAGMAIDVTYNPQLEQQARQAAAEIDKLNNKMERVGNSIEQELETPMEKFNRRIETAIKANLAGSLSDSLLQRALIEYTEDLNEEVNRLERTVNRKLNTTLVGSVAAFEAMVNSMYDRTDSSGKSIDTGTQFDVIRSAAIAEREALYATIDAAINPLLAQMDKLTEKSDQIQASVNSTVQSYAAGNITLDEANKKLQQMRDEYAEVEAAASKLESRIRTIDENAKFRTPSLENAQDLKGPDTNAAPNRRRPNLPRLFFERPSPGIEDSAFANPLNGVGNQITTAITEEGRITRLIDERIARAVETMARNSRIIVEEGVA